MSDRIETAEELAHALTPRVMDALEEESPALFDEAGDVIAWHVIRAAFTLHRPDRPSDLERLRDCQQAMNVLRAKVDRQAWSLRRADENRRQGDAARAELAALKAGIEGLAARDEDGPLPRRRIIPEALRALLTPAHEIPAHVCDSGNFDRSICPDPWAVDAANVAARDVEGSGSDE